MNSMLTSTQQDKKTKGMEGRKKKEFYCNDSLQDRKRTTEACR